MNLQTWTLAQRPELEARMWAIGDQGMPEFMLHDVAAGLHFDHLTSDYVDYVVLACDADDPDIVLARGLSVPFAMGFGRRTVLPSRGWDQVIALGARRPRRRTRADAFVRAGDQRPRRGECGPRGRRRRTRRSVAAEPQARAPAACRSIRWLRVHVRAGAEIVAVCPASMTITGTLAQWRDWTGLPTSPSTSSRMSGCGTAPDEPARAV